MHFQHALQYWLLHNSLSHLGHHPIPWAVHIWQMESRTSTAVIESGWTVAQPLQSKSLPLVPQVLQGDPFLTITWFCFSKQVLHHFLFLLHSLQKAQRPLTNFPDFCGVQPLHQNASSISQFMSVFPCPTVTYVTGCSCCLRLRT